MTGKPDVNLHVISERQQAMLDQRYGRGSAAVFVWHIPQERATRIEVAILGRQFQADIHDRKFRDLPNSSIDELLATNAEQLMGEAANHYIRTLGIDQIIDAAAEQAASTAVAENDAAWKKRVDRILEALGYADDPDLPNIDDVLDDTKIVSPVEGVSPCLAYGDHCSSAHTEAECPTRTMTHADDTPKENPNA